MNFTLRLPVLLMMAALPLPSSESAECTGTPAAGAGFAAGPGRRMPGAGRAQAVQGLRRTAGVRAGLGHRFGWIACHLRRATRVVSPGKAAHSRLLAATRTTWKGLTWDKMMFGAGRAGPAVATAHKVLGSDRPGHGVRGGRSPAPARPWRRHLQSQRSRSPAS